MNLLLPTPCVSDWNPSVSQSSFQGFRESEPVVTSLNRWEPGGFSSETPEKSFAIGTLPVTYKLPAEPAFRTFVIN